MPLAGIQLNRDLTTTSNRGDILRDGNVVYGKITKLFPNQRAEVQIGEHKMIAQITTPLAVGDRHFFQVQHHQGVIELKVLGERLQNIQDTNIVDLLSRLGIANNKVNRDFVQSLIQQRIPFTQAQLSQALAILATFSSNQAEVSQVLQHMIQHRLPINESVFQALFTQMTQSLTTNMTQMVKQLQQQPSLQPVESQLLQALQTMIQGESEVTQRMGNHMHQMNEPTLFNLLKFMRAIPMDKNQETWQNELRRTITMQQSGQRVTPLLNEGQTEQVKQLMANQSQIQMAIRTILQSVPLQSLLMSQATESTTQSMIATQNQTTQLQQLVNETLLPLLPEDVRATVTEFTSSDRPVQVPQLLQFFQTFANVEVYEVINRLVTLVEEQQTPVNMKQQFLNQLENHVQRLGLSDEQQLSAILRLGQEHMTGLLQDQRMQTSIKSLLIQMINQGQDTSLSDRAQSLIHFINGMQLHGLNETQNMIQVMFQMPGHAIGLNQDLFLNFEGKKDEDGKLDPNYCRILFVFNLAHLRETIIDMHVQKRMVSLTIFNEYTNDSNIKLLQPALTEGLKELNYKLSGIRLKPLHERIESKPRNKTDRYYHSDYKEGVEFFI